MRFETTLLEKILCLYTLLAEAVSPVFITTITNNKKITLI
jgi:hypothetical protein